MNLPRFSVNNPHFTIIVFIVLISMGIYGVLDMPSSEDPPINPPMATVVLIYPGASPIDLEGMVVDHLEEAINEIENIKELNVDIENGLVVLQVEFEAGEDPDDKYEKIHEKLNEVRPKLPKEIHKIIVEKVTTSNVAVLQLALVSETLSYRELYDLADEIKNIIERIRGVKSAEIEGSTEEIVSVELDLEKLAQYRIPLTRVFNSIASRSANIPGGFITLGRRRFNIQTSGDYGSLEEIENTIIALVGDAPVYLKEVAKVSFGYKDHLYKTRFNGRRCLFLPITQKDDSDIFELTATVKSRLPQLRAALPQGASLEVGFDQSRNVAKRVKEFVSNLLLGIVLVGLVVFLAISMRTALIIMIAIPSSFLIGLGFLDLFGFGLQQITIGGLIIALGLLVDNSIVVTENIVHCMKWGKMGIKQASIEGTAQVAWPIFSSTVTTALAFLPIALMPGMVGDFIRSLPITVVLTLGASLFLALTFTPFLSSKIITAGKGHRPNIFQRMLIKFINSYYHRALSWSMGHTRTVLGLTLLVFLISLSLFPLVGVSFFPKAEKPQFLINVELPSGTSIETTDKFVRYVEGVLASRPEVENYMSNVGMGNPRIYYNTGRKRENAYFGQILVQVHDRELGKLPGLIKDLRARFADFPAGRIEIKELQQGPPVEAPIAIKVIGNNLNVLSQIAADVEEMIRSTRGTININNPLRFSSTDLSIKINHEKASMLGISSLEIDRTVRTAIAGMPASTYRDEEGDAYDIVLRLPVNNDPGLDDFDRIYLNSYSGEPITLRQVAGIEFKRGYQRINHFNLERSVTVTADIAGRNVNEATTEVLEKLKAYHWPPNYQYYVGGELESREESFGGMERAVLIALVSIFGVLILQFRSFLQPLIIFTAIPLAVIGAIVALLVTGYNFSFTAFLGLTSLMGIVVNDSIILVDYANVLRKEEKELSEAVLLASKTRFMPVIITSITTIGGLLPLTLQGGSLWGPMGWAIIGGLSTSTILTLVVVPVLYTTIASKRPV
ncbi:MAG TPA: efflux RND transporter permease subunit [archaeon]|nr:efflux RND transporter permease subunit [archaeon]